MHARTTLARAHACTHDAENAQADSDTHQHTHAHTHTRTRIRMRVRTHTPHIYAARMHTYARTRKTNPSHARARTHRHTPPFHAQGRARADRDMPKRTPNLLVTPEWDRPTSTPRSCPNPYLSDPCVRCNSLRRRTVLQLGVTRRNHATRCGTSRPTGRFDDAVRPNGAQPR
jgi:hypothetical protein